MARWRLFGRSKENEEEQAEEIIQEEPEQDITEVEEDTPLAEYNETLQTGAFTSKEGGATASDQRIWRDVEGIEEKIDKLHITRAQKPVTELDKKVDKIVSKVKLKNEEKTRTPSNVIYVVSKPQPGEVRGDWAVRSHGKIFSHHKTKEKAIEEARKIAKVRSATVLVQNTDGTFSEGFKPK